MMQDKRVMQAICCLSLVIGPVTTPHAWEKRGLPAGRMFLDGQFLAAKLGVGVVTTERGRREGYLRVFWGFFGFLVVNLGGERRNWLW